MTDDATLQFYAANAAAYVAHTDDGTSPRLTAFLEQLTPGVHILELGSGSGKDAKRMLERGFEVTPTDGSPELAAEAARLLQRPVRVMRFDALEASEEFDAVYASASLLHAPRAALSGILARAHRALRPKGLFWATYKAGDAEGIDRFGRYYNYLDETALRRHYAEAASWRTLELSYWDGSGYDHQPTRWLGVKAQK